MRKKSKQKHYEHPTNREQAAVDAGFALADRLKQYVEIATEWERIATELAECMNGDHKRKVLANFKRLKEANQRAMA